MPGRKTIDSLCPDKRSSCKLTNGIIKYLPTTIVIFIFSLILIYVWRDPLFEKNNIVDDKEDPLDVGKAILGSVILTIIILFIIWLVRGLGCPTRKCN